MASERGPQSQNTAHQHSKRPVILIYPTVSPETVVVPIVSCIFGFPLVALLIICCLRRRAQLSRDQARRRACDGAHGRSSGRSGSLRQERSMSRGFPSLELDTVVEEPDHTVIEAMTPEDENDNEDEENNTNDKR